MFTNQEAGSSLGYAHSWTHTWACHVSSRPFRRPRFCMIPPPSPTPPHNATALYHSTLHTLSLFEEHFRTRMVLEVKKRKYSWARWNSFHIFTIPKNRFGNKERFFATRKWGFGHRTLLLEGDQFRTRGPLSDNIRPTKIEKETRKAHPPNGHSVGRKCYQEL